MIKKENTRVTFVLPKKMCNDLIKIAEYEGRSLSNLILQIIKNYLKNRKNNRM